MGEILVLVSFLVLPLLLAGLMRWCVNRFRSSGRKITIGRLVAGNALVFLFLLSLLAAAGEVYFRFLYDETDSMAYTRASQRWFQRYWIRNSAGFRDNLEYALQVEPGKRRVSFLGDSFAAGHGIKSVEDRFANLIRASRPDWEIHVLAKIGADTAAELNTIDSSFASGYQADQVVLVYCLNDVSDLLEQWNSASALLRADAARAGWLRRHSYLLDTLHHRLLAVRNPFLKSYYFYVSEGYRGAVWETQKERLTALRDAVSAGGGRLSVVTFPFLHAVGSDYPFQSAHDELNRFWRALGVPHLDLLPAFSNLRPSNIVVNRFDAHPNERAHALAAQEIEPFLDRQLSSLETAVESEEQNGNHRWTQSNTDFPGENGSPGG